MPEVIHLVSEFSDSNNILRLFDIFAKYFGYTIIITKKPQNTDFFASSIAPMLTLGCTRIQKKRAGE